MRQSAGIQWRARFSRPRNRRKVSMMDVQINAAKVYKIYELNGKTTGGTNLTYPQTARLLVRNRWKDVKGGWRMKFLDKKTG